MIDNGTYSTKHELPAYPNAKIKFTHPKIPTLFQETEALIDSGSGVTLIPKQMAIDLDLKPSNYRRIRDFQRKHTELKPVYPILVTIGNFEELMEVYETDGNSIIGRDVLNRYKTTLFGKQQKWEIE